ncbi:MAG TPA: glucoamylase family protein [Chitinophagaceae bacterium]|nr:glucoamylase family protein [Chitinophagaceae bacterium]
MQRSVLYCLLFSFLLANCKKKDSSPSPVQPEKFDYVGVSINGQPSLQNVSLNPFIRITFSEAVEPSTVNSAVSLKKGAAYVAYNFSLENSNKTILLRPTTILNALDRYTLTITTALKATVQATLRNEQAIGITTGIDSAHKFPLISDAALLDKVQQQTFKYFWDFGHPVSGLARERNTSGDLVTSGGSGFGIMAIPVAVERGFITRAEGLVRLQKITGFLKNTAVKVKGAFSHWLNGSTGAIMPFSANDNGADLVETSFLMMGLLTARQYFDGGGEEATLRSDITTLYNNVEWDWFRRDGENVLYWHYSEDKGWAMNLPVRGWNECLITYVLAAASTTHTIPAEVYNNGWKGSSGYANGNTYFGYQLPLGPALGGPLFLSHYSFLGINPNGLSDGTVNYFTQNKNHTLINYNYCLANPKAYYGYSDSVWGLTASDIQNGYTASSPANDVGVIAPTAAISAIPYTPDESMAALKFFYYVLGDKLWKEYGFVDAFSLHTQWFASSHLAIDQGPIIIMIENYRSKLVWDLFTSCPEVKAGMTKLGFTAPYL